MNNQKNRFWTFVLSLVPGAGEMYFGLYRQGVSLMLCFWALFILPMLLQISALSLLALVANVEMFWELGRVFQEIADQWNAYYVGNGVAFLVECLLLFLVFCVVACLEFYTPLAIGHSFAQHKMLLSVAFFFAIQVVTQIVSGMLLFAGVPMLDSMDGWLNSLTPATAIHGFMWGSILISAIYGAILYCITIRMLHRHLNLE